MAMEKKLMFVAFGYLLLLAALDASIAAPLSEENKTHGLATQMMELADGGQLLRMVAGTML
jgi:hypothetical protein